jgi:hypothetical protein
MPLDKPGLIAQLTSIFSDVAPASTPAQKAQAIADAVDLYVKTATVTVTVPAATFLVAATAGVPNPAPVPVSGTLS